MPVRVLLLTQGHLGEELARAARKIAGDGKSLETLSLAWDEDPDSAERRLEEHLAAGDPTDGVLILTDVPGGTPFNVARRLVDPGQIEVLSGVNLPMVVRLCCPGCADDSVATLAQWIVEKGRTSIARGEPAKACDRG